MTVMDTNRLSAKLTDALNEQIMKEAHASQIYLSYGTWADSEGYAGIANFLFRHAHEERNHMMKILEYVQERGSRVKILAIPSPDSDPVSVNNCFEKVYTQEVSNTKSIYNIVNLSMEEKDWATWQFMQWFVKEQTEEETMSLNLLNKIKIAGGNKAKDDALYALDKDLASAPGDARLAEEATSENP